MTNDALTQARTHLESSWYRYMADRNFQAKIPDWRTLTAADGTDLLSVKVVGPAAAHALARFIATGPIGLPTPGDTRPTVDYSIPDRVAYVWRSYGVWVELWVPEAQTCIPHPDPEPEGGLAGVVLSAPAPVPAQPATARSGLGARFRFTRRPKGLPAA